MTKKLSAKSAKKSAERETKKVLAAARTADSFQNFLLNLGLGTDNALSGSTYGFNPITRIRTLLEWVHRGSWVGGVAVDLVADDMTRAGIEILSDMDPSDIQKMNKAAVKWNVWGSIHDNIAWGRLYGGSIAVLLIDGQDPSTPLRLERIAKGQFRGLLVLDRWMVEPSLEDLIQEMGTEMGQPRYYRVTADSPGLRGQKIHYSRVIRHDGIRLPYWQRLSENLWGISVIERIYDRMVAFDSATTGAAQLVYKSYLRTLKLDKFREAVAMGGDALKGVFAQVQMMRQFQSQEGITVLDSKDEFDVDDHGSFAGISDALLQFAQQLAGALQIPLVRLLGQSPAGLNATGDADLRTYYDGINNQQERTLRTGIDRVYRAMAAGEGIALPEDWMYRFAPLWQLSGKEKAEMGKTVGDAVANMTTEGIISRGTALKELRASARETGMWSSITDEEIKEAENEPPLPMGESENGNNGEPDGSESSRSSEGGEAGKDAAFDLGGLPIVIETPKGATRRGNDFSAIMPAHYGYISGTQGLDGDSLDCFVGPNLSSDRVWLIEQRHPGGSVDEHKVMLGFDTWPQAAAAYMGSFSDESGAERIGKVLKLSIDGLKRWITDNAAKPNLRVA